MEAFVLMVVLQGITELAELFISPFFPETRFNKRMINMLIMIVLTIVLICYAKVRKQALSFFPEKFSKRYIIATCIAAAIGNIRHLKFAARDRYAGATKYNEHSEYVKSKNIVVEGPHEKLEAVQVALATYYELDKKLTNHERIISHMSLDCPEGVAAGRELFNDSILRQLVEKNGSAADAFREICNRLK